MIVTIDWLATAHQQRIDQIAFIAKEDRFAAADQDDEIEQQIDQLYEHPLLGHPGRVLGTRELTIVRTRFIAVYIADEAPEKIDITIIRLLHTSMRYP